MEWCRHVYAIPRRYRSDASKNLFSKCDAEGTHTAKQIRYINADIDELTSKQTMDPARLYNSPFSVLTQTGLKDLLSADGSGQMFDLMGLVQKRPRPAIAA